MKDLALLIQSNSAGSNQRNNSQSSGYANNVVSAGVGVLGVGFFFSSGNQLYVRDNVGAGSLGGPGVNAIGSIPISVNGSQLAAFVGVDLVLIGVVSLQFEFSSVLERGLTAKGAMIQKFLILL